MSRQNLIYRQRILAGKCRECNRKRNGQSQTFCNRCLVICRIKNRLRKNLKRQHPGGPGKWPFISDEKGLA